MRKGLSRRNIKLLGGLLALLLLAVIGFTGWFVYHSQQVADKSYADAAKSSSVTYAKKRPTTASTQQYLTIKEWGVRIPLTAGESDLTYSAETESGATSYRIKSPSIAKLCGAGWDGTLGVIGRSVNDYTKQGSYQPEVKVGTYFYTMGVIQNPCSQDDAVSNKDVEASVTLNKQFKLLQAVPQQYLTIKEWGVKLAFSGDMPVGALYTAPQAAGSLSPGVDYVTLATKDTLHINLTCGGQPGDGDEPVTHGTSTNPTHLLRAHTKAELQSASNGDSKNYTHIGDYYYVYQGSTGFGDCGFTDAAVLQKFKSENIAYSSATILPE